MRFFSTAIYNAVYTYINTFLDYLSATFRRNPLYDIEDQSSEGFYAMGGSVIDKNL